MWGYRLHHRTRSGHGHWAFLLQGPGAVPSRHLGIASLCLLSLRCLLPWLRASLP